MNDTSPSDIEFCNVVKRYGAVQAVNGPNFSVRRGSFHSFLGGSGCGKTTTLRMIAGFEQPTRGEVRLAGQNVAGVPAFERPVNMVFQHYALFPHLTVAQNIAYGLRYRTPRPDKKTQLRMADEALEMVRLSGFGQRKPSELSGGQQQRVAIARALAMEPEIILFDEPTSALDPELVGEVLKVIQTLAEEGRTMLMVTHEMGFARQVSSQVLFLHQGRVEEQGSAQILDHPGSERLQQFLSNRLK